MDIDKMEDEDGDLMRAPGVETVSDLLNSQRLKLHLKSIKESESNYDNTKTNNGIYSRALKMKDYELIKQSNLLVLEIDNHILRIHKFVRDIYATKFPELEEMVINPIEYAKCVKLIANKTPEEMSDLDLRRVLSNPSVAMTVHVTATTTTGKKLQLIDLRRVEEGADSILKLENKKLEILKYVSSRMSLIAPNLSTLIGSELTAQLIGLVGGIKELSTIPACNIQVLGSTKKNTTFLGSFQHHTTTTNKDEASNNGKEPINPNAAMSYHHHYAPHFGIIASCELIRMCPKEFQQRALRVVAAKIVLAARVDANQNTSKFGINSNNAAYGQKLYSECFKKIQKWQEPPPPKPPRPLSVPDTKPKKKRGGKRYRKMRERTKVTETQRMQNRMAFNKPEEEVIDGNGDIIGLGMLGNAADAGGRLRNIKPKNLQSNLHKIHNRQVLKQKRMRMRAEKAGTVTGLTTSVVFTAVQGIELSNPDIANKNKLKSSKYFNQD